MSHARTYGLVLVSYTQWVTAYLGEVDELVEEVSLAPGGAGCGGGQVEVAGNLGNQGRIAVVLAVPASTITFSLCP